MPTQIVNISLPNDLVKKIDQAAKGNYASRSEYIRQAVVSRLQSQDSDIWEALAVGADEVRTKAKQAGYSTDADFVRAVKEARRSNKKA
jgi:Arc/MetJ-type ribon-helix-helix transcriptional regulator